MNLQCMYRSISSGYMHERPFVLISHTVTKLPFLNIHPIPEKEKPIHPYLAGHDFGSYSLGPPYLPPVKFPLCDKSTCCNSYL